jgi:hypothetical protein
MDSLSEILENKIMARMILLHSNIERERERERDKKQAEGHTERNSDKEMLRWPQIP